MADRSLSISILVLVCENISSWFQSILKLQCHRNGSIYLLYIRLPSICILLQSIPYVFALQVPVGSIFIFMQIQGTSRYFVCTHEMVSESNMSADFLIMSPPIPDCFNFYSFQFPIPVHWIITSVQTHTINQISSKSLERFICTRSGTLKWHVNFRSSRFCHVFHLRARKIAEYTEKQKWWANWKTKRFSMEIDCFRK